MSVESHPDPRIVRVRAELERDGLDAVVLTHPNDVVYATGYGSVLERWGLQEPLSAAIVARRGPVVLLAPQALLGLLPLRSDGTTPVRAESGRPTSAAPIRKTRSAAGVTRRTSSFLPKRTIPAPTVAKTLRRSSLSRVASAFR